MANLFYICQTEFNDMVTITENKLIIEIEHVCPSDLFNDIRSSLIFNMQNLDYVNTVDMEIKNSNYFTLLLLKEMLEVKLLSKK